VVLGVEEALLATLAHAALEQAAHLLVHRVAGALQVRLCGVHEAAGQHGQVGGERRHSQHRRGVDQRHHHQAPVSRVCRHSTQPRIVPVTVAEWEKYER